MTKKPQNSLSFVYWACSKSVSTGSCQILILLLFFCNPKLLLCLMFTQIKTARNFRDHLAQFISHIEDFYVLRFFMKFASFIYNELAYGPQSSSLKAFQTLVSLIVQPKYIHCHWICICSSASIVFHPE